MYENKDIYIIRYSLKFFNPPPPRKNFSPLPKKSHPHLKKNFSTPPEKISTPPDLAVTSLIVVLKSSGIQITQSKCCNVLRMREQLQNLQI